MRKVIARWLAPEIALKAEGWDRLKASLHGGSMWLGEFPQASAATERVLERMRGWERKPGEEINYKWDAYIGHFRGQLSRMGSAQ